jgi:hypothetical protein
MDVPNRRNCNHRILIITVYMRFIICPIYLSCMSNENRGLASADEETGERVARKGGEASHGSGRGDGEDAGGSGDVDLPQCLKKREKE